MGNGRVFGQHRLVKLTLPGLRWLIALLSLAVLYLLPKSFDPARAIAM